MADPEAIDLDAEMPSCIRILKAVQARATKVQWEQPLYAELKKTVRQFNLLFEKQTFGGATMEEYVLQRVKKQEEALKKARVARLKQLDKNYINNRQLRADRIRALNNLTEQQNHLTFVQEKQLALEDDSGEVEPKSKRKCTAAGVTATEEESTAAEETKEEQAPSGKMGGRKKGFSQQPGLFDAQLRQEADAEVERCLDRARVEAEASMQQEEKECDDMMYSPRSCYTCKRRYHQLHHFYDQLCPECAELNWKKRNQVADLRGKVALLTGGRVKIGFECGLKLLRCGCRVIITTRFPHDCAKRYSEASDYANWSGQLEIFGLDLRDLRAVTNFTKMMNETYDRLDFIINNAAQTVRRPPAYYKHLMQIEMTPREQLPAPMKDVIRGDGHSVSSLLLPSSNNDNQNNNNNNNNNDNNNNSSNENSDTVRLHTPTTTTIPSSSSSTSTSGEITTAAGVTSEGIIFTENRTANTAAALSQVALLEQDASTDAALFPEGKFDVTGQQLDLRQINSWTTLIDQVEPSEAIECLAINTMAPFILNGKLKALMVRTEGDKFIVNVSAMEGKFYRHKGPQHPHTNMAKAALNMITRTCAQDYARSRIYMNSVDTGWINDENPHDSASRIAEDNNFQTPIDEMDAMARVLDPVIDGVNSGKIVSGLFLKDFNPTEW